MSKAPGYFDEIRKIEQIRRQELKNLRQALQDLEQKEKVFTGRTQPSPLVVRHRKAPSR